MVSNIGFSQWTNGLDIYNTTAGKVGIGTNVPSEKLHIYEGSNTIVKLRLENRTTFGGENFGFNLVSDANNGFFDLLQYGKFGIKINSNEYFTILGTGLIGINNSSPTELLDITGGNIAIRNNFAQNRVLTSDANGVGTWQEIALSIINDTIRVNNFSPKSLLDYKQNLNLANNILSISNGNNIDLSSYSQNLSITNNKLALSSSNDTINLVTYLDNTDQQILDLINDTLSITGSTNKISLTPYLPLTEAQVDAFANNNGYLTTEQDADPQNEIQQLNFANNQLSISGGNSINLTALNHWTRANSDLYYNQGKVGVGIETPASNLHLHNSQNDGSNTFSNKGIPDDGSSVVSAYSTARFQLTNKNTGVTATDGLLIKNKDYDAVFNLQEDGNMSFMTNKNKGFYINNNGNTGIGIETPQSTLHIHNSTTASSGGGNVGTGGYGKSGDATNETASTIQITNASTGSGENNGLFISAFEKSGIINLNEIGYFDIKMQDESAFRINSNKKVWLSSLTGSGERIVTVSSYGELRANTSIDALSIWSKNGNIAYYDNGNVGIGVNTTSFKLDVNGRLKVRGSDFILGTDDGREQGINLANRALVHAGNDNLIINYAGDFEGGVLIPSEPNLLPNNAQLTIKGNGGNAKGDAYISFKEGAEVNSIWSVGVKDIGNMFAITNSTLITEAPKFVILESNGNVGIGTDTPREKLTVKGKILSEENIVVYDANTSTYPDYVFDDNYKPISLKSLDKYITKYNHLPEIPTTADVERDGIKLGEMNIKLLEKVEELTLYTIEQQKLIDDLLKRIEKIEKNK